MSNWASHVSGLGPSFMKIWTCGSSPRSESRNCLNADQKRTRSHSYEQIWIFSARSKWIPVAICDYRRNVVISLWPGDKATINGVAAWRIQKSTGKFLASVFWGSRRHAIHWLSSKGPNCQRAVLLIQCLCNWRTFWRKNAAERSPSGVLFLHENVSAHRALATQKKLAYFGFQCLDHPTYSPDLAPSHYYLFLGLKR